MFEKIEFANGILTVYMRNGKNYSYHAEFSDYLQFKQAASAGSYYNQNIKNKLKRI